MADKITELKQERARLIQEARSHIDAAELRAKDAGSANINAEDQAKYDTIYSDISNLEGRIEREERQRELERKVAERTAEEMDQAGTRAEKKHANVREEVRSWLLTGSRPQSGEFRNLQVGSDTQAGYLVMPEIFAQELIKFVDDQVFMRQLGTSFQVPNAESLGAVSLDQDPADADWTTELATGNEDSTMAFGKRSLTPRPLAKRIKVSESLLRRAMMAPESLVQQRLAYKFAVTEEKAFLTGNGSNQPLGIFTASADGIPTSQNISTGNTTTQIKMDNLFEVKYALKSNYHPRAAWIFHRDAVKQIAKLKDGNGQYLWQPSVVAGTPDRLLNSPVYLSEYAPNTFTTGLVVGAYGDFSTYWIADAMNMQIKRLVELYAETDQIGYIARKETDGMPTLAEAIARVTLA